MMRPWSFAVAALATAVLSLDAQAGQECPGDCNGDRVVGLSEIITCAAAATQVGAEPICSIDQDNDGNVTVDELVAAVGASVHGCPELYTITVCLGQFGQGDSCSDEFTGIRIFLEPLGWWRTIGYEYKGYGGDGIVVFKNDVPPGQYTLRTDCNPFFCWPETPVTVTDSDVFVVLTNTSPPRPPVRLVIGSDYGAPGSSVEIPISIEGVLGSATAVGMDVLFDAAALNIDPQTDCWMDPRLELEEQFWAGIPSIPVLDTPPGLTRMRLAVLFKFDGTVIPTFGDGEIARCVFHISPDAVPGTYSLAGERHEVVEPSSRDLPSQVIDGSIAVCEYGTCL